MERELSADDAVAELVDWWRHGESNFVELVGPSGSGKTGVLLRLAERVPEAVMVDATGLTTEDLRDAVCDATGLPWVEAERNEWSSSERKLVLVANAHRAGVTRRSSHPQRIVRTDMDDLAEVGGLSIVIETDDFPRSFSSPDRLILLSHYSPVEVDDLPMAVKALALAEMRHVPMPVWQALVRLRARRSIVGRSKTNPGQLLRCRAP